MVAVALTAVAADAAGRSRTTTTVTVEVIGRGTVSSTPAGVSCGAGSTSCYVTFTAGGDVTLAATPASGWEDGIWGDDCVTGSTATPCVLAAGSDHVVTASFTSPSGTTRSTLTVTYSVGEGAGYVSGPEPAPPGGEIDCGDGTKGGAPATARSTCTWTALTGSTLTLFETPQPGSIFGRWSGSCAGTGTWCTVELAGDTVVTAAFADPGSTTATAAGTSPLTVTVSGSGKVKGGGLSCPGPGTCTANEPETATVTLTADPDDGSTFSGWTGACAGAGDTCTLSMDAARAVTAAFTPVIPLHVDVDGGGTVSGGGGEINCGHGGNLCSATFAKGTLVTLLALPTAGWAFSGWAGACGGATAACTVSMSEERSVGATFAAAAAAGAPAAVTTPSSGTTTYRLTVTVTGAGRVTGGGIDCGAGSTACTADLAAGAAVTLTAAPAAGSTFAGWTATCAGTATGCRVTMNAAKTVAAAFAGPAAAPRLVNLTLAVAGPGTVFSPKGSCASTGKIRTCVQRFRAGASATLTATPRPGRSFLGWGGACGGTSRRCTASLSAARSVSATFSTTVHAALSGVGKPVVVRAKRGYLVTLRIRTTTGGTVRVRALRAGRAAVSLSRRVAAGAASVGPFRVAQSGLYTFEARLAGHVVREQACLGRCGAGADAPPFALTREPPVVTKAGDGWSVVLHARASQVSEARVRAYRDGTLFVDQSFLGRAARITLGPFLLERGTYSLRLVATDPWGRTRRLVWVVSPGG